MHRERKAAGLAGVNVCFPAQDLAYVGWLVSTLVQIDIVDARQAGIEAKMMAVVEFEPSSVSSVAAAKAYKNIVVEFAVIEHGCPGA